ncbi:MAG: transposase [Clostridia bacterium]|nr:transposase [Clostridia bacterium]
MNVPKSAKGTVTVTHARPLKSRVGELRLQVPRSWNGSFSTDLFERYQRSEQALLLAMIEMVVNGVFT